MPHNPAASRRVLLPAEAELCNALGLSEEEYWYFVELTDAYNGKRDEAYELAGVPDVQNGFLVPILISLVVGIALSAIGYLLAPKPKQQQQKTPPQLKTADSQGASRYTTNSGFDSAQELASLGEVVPLVFANRVGSVGGIRVKCMLLWSQLLSFGTGQQLKILTLLSAGELAADPDFAGFAIGDQTLKNYTLAKVGLYRRLMGGRIQEGNRYPEGTIAANPAGDVFTVYDDGSESYKTWFCGNRTTSTQTQFGCFSPMPNATPYKLPYELILNQKNLDAGIRDDNNRKREKINREWRTLAAINYADANYCSYYIHGGKEDPQAYPPYGLDDVNNATEDRRNNADDSIQMGGLYMAGTAQVVCISSSTDQTWTLGTDKTYTFKIEEPGEIQAFDLFAGGNPNYGYVLQRMAIGTISNNRGCHVTEIGIKSKVWKQISGFPNVNSQPSAAVIASYEQRDGSIQLGSIQRYVTRYSFFRLEARPLGTTAKWQDITGGRLFCIQGNSPQDQYNFLRIAQPFGQYEYRMVPYPGAAVVRYWQGRSVFRLNPGALMRYTTGQFVVTFTGEAFRVSPGRMTNPDWTVGAPPPSIDPAVDVTPRSDGTPRPGNLRWVMAEERFSRSWYGQYYVLTSSLNNLPLFAIWAGRYVSLGQEYRMGGPGFLNLRAIQRWELRWIDDPPSATVVVGTASEHGSGMTLRVSQWPNGHADWTLASGGQGYFTGDRYTVTAFGRTFSGTVIADNTSAIANSLNVWDAVADIGKYDAERTSHEDGPEHELVYVNEIVRQEVAPQYEDMALLGLRLSASKEWSNFQQLSAYVKKGIKVNRLIDDNGVPTTTLAGPTNNFAEIAYALLTDDRLGAGELLGSAATDRDRMTKAAQFCRANGFTWDGVIGQKLNLRDFIFENAGYCLLDFTILGGQFSLVPSVPVTSDHVIDRTAQPPISALFTDGNIRDLTVSWLSPEERQLFKAVVKWRQETDNGFSQERLFTMRLSDEQGGSDSDGEEVFDLSDFCTTQQQAEIFAKYALKLRKEVDHGLKFSTTPQSAMGLEPGAYFRLVSEVTHTSRFNNGAINSEGLITSTSTLADGSYNVLTWEPGTVGVIEDTLEVKDGKALEAGLFGRVFTLKNSTTSSRVYKVESISYGQEGFVEIAGSYQPLTADGALAVLDWTDEHFVVEVG